MRKVALPVVVSLVALLGPMADASTEPTYVTHNCTHTAIKPNRIMFACADGGYYVNHLHWAYWYEKKAKGRGVFHQNDCNPDCAGGTFHKAKGRIVLERKRWCADIKRWVFRHARVHYDKPLLGRDGDSFKLFCPI